MHSLSLKVLGREYRKKILLGITLIVISSAAILSGMQFLSFRNGTLSSNTKTVGSQAIVELTDPPVVPQGTSSLNLTYSAIELTLSVSESTASQTVSIIPGGGSSTVDLMKLGNESQTIGLALVQNGSEVTSVAFLVSKITIEVNNTDFPVTLATGGNTIPVMITDPVALDGSENALLLQFNPTILGSSGNYQLAPSSLGVIKPHSEITPAERNIGSVQNLTAQDFNALNKAKGSLSAELTSLSVSGNVTSFNVQVINDGNNPERLILFGIRGDFDFLCPPFGTSDWRSHQWKDYCRGGTSEIMLIPGEPHTPSTTTTVIPCESRHLSPVNLPDIENDINDPIIMNPGQCLSFSFSGVLMLGGHAIVPDIKHHDKLEIHVFAGNRADTRIICSVQSDSTNFASCTPDADNGSW